MIELTLENVSAVPDPFYYPFSSRTVFAAIRRPLEGADGHQQEKK
jgi:hypothetical protein